MPRFELSPNLPFDVDVVALRKLDRDTQIPEAQRLFDVFAWQAFIALNWPAGPDGTADRSKTLRDSVTPRVWMAWRQNETVFRPDGARPEPWNGARQAVPTDHYMWRSSKMLDESRSPLNELTETVQAFTGPLIDQNGAFVRYESYMNEPQFDYIVQNGLYSQEGQLAFTAKGQLIEFPANVIGATPRHGSMGIKLAWKELGDNDIPARYLTRPAVVVKTTFDAQGKMVKTKVPRLMGLVGMHVTALTQSSPNWIWATFEHIDNVVSNDLAFGVTRSGAHGRVRPSFNNPDTPTKRVNILPPRNALPDANSSFTTWDEAKTTNPTQLTRLIAIPPATAALNADVQAVLRSEGSVLQYYELIGTQWPVQPGFPAFGGGSGSAPESILFKAPGRVVPVYLVNTTMESYFQVGDQVAGPLEEDDRLPAGKFADGAGEAVTPDRTRVFGTESCVGCHFSAGVVIGFKTDENGRFLTDASGRKLPIYGKNGSFGQTGHAGYVWQLQLKARSTQPATSGH
ncbi:MAG TPA: hypothetical protein VN428_02045 [Bryobacteraceae bacterium]|nr:hypothetical protein [Bryobacteraceae bacterium]